MKKVKTIRINHPVLGDIILNTTIPDEFNDKIGTLAPQFNRTPLLYHGDVTENHNGTFNVSKIHAIQATSFIVGSKKFRSGWCSSVDIYTNLSVECDDTVIYPSAVMSVTYF